MSSRSPRVPRLPARVYWFRRVLLLGLAGLLVWLGAGAVDLVSGQVGDPRSNAAGNEDTGTGAPDAADPPVPAREPSRQPRGRDDRPAETRNEKSEVTSPLAAAAGRCDPAAVEVRPSVRGSPVIEEPVPLGLTLTTTSPGGCRLVTGSDRLLVQVTDAQDEPVWDTGRCPEAVPERNLVLRPGWQLFVGVEWSGRRADRGCSGLTAAAEPGAYVVRAAVVGGEPGSAGFDLSREPARPKPRTEPQT